MNDRAKICTSIESFRKSKSPIPNSRNFDRSKTWIKSKDNPWKPGVIGRVEEKAGARRAGKMSTSYG